MPRANWGIDASDVDEFDRDSQYKPYTGPTPPLGVYMWLIKKLQFVAGTREKNPQLRVGLELVPRADAPDESKYADYFRMAFLVVSEKTRFQYVPFLDAIGVSGREFTKDTIMDAEGNVKKIGKWRNTGEEYVMAELKNGEDQNGNSRLEIGYIGPVEDYDEEESDDDYYDEEDPV